MNLAKHSEFSALTQEFFIDQLAEEIVLEHPDCGMCIRGGCGRQMSGLTCRYGVRDWLTAKKHNYDAELTAELEKQFRYLDQLRDSSVTNMYGASPHLEQAFPGWSRDWYKNVLRLWMDTFGERTGT